MLEKIGMIIVNEVLTKTEVVMSLIALIGLLLQRKPIEKVVSGVIKTYVGVAMFTLGLNALQDAVFVFTNYFVHLLGADTTAAVSPYPLLADTAAVNAAAGFMLLIGYIVNILVARFTRMKIIYLTGHWSYFMGQFVAACLMNYLGILGPASVIIGGIILGLYQCVFPYILQPYTEKLTGGGPFALGHGASIFCVFGSWLASKVGKPEDSFENVKVTGRWSFLKEIVVTLSISMVAMFIILAVANGKEYVTSVSGGQNWILYSVYSGLKFAASFMVLLYGVRTFIAEITPAFKGISEKLVPGAIPAFDAPVFFQYGPTSLIIGFVVSTIFSAIGMVITMGMNLSIPIMMVNVENFFGGGIAAIYANKFGGKRAVIIVAALFGLLTTVGRVLYFPMITANLEWAQIACDADQTVVITLIGWIGRLLGLAQYTF